MAERHSGSWAYRLAAAAIADQRAQWRPVLISASQEVDESVPGELLIEVRNVGRGPALGVGGQLRIAGPSGAAKPRQPNICLPGEIWSYGLESMASIREVQSATSKSPTTT